MLRVVGVPLWVVQGAGLGFS
ncbi:MAG: hypothetical protein JWM76_139, partial [Pseudonocardiales bacterium]|nr:hypothetical protein [Pseudonocardiales bacterium]